jgi:D-glycero-D-manno-heptose 1,7-bisphosphate phosphatase
VGVAELADRAAVFLDRDGVLNRSFGPPGKPAPPRSVAEITIEDGVEEACALLRDAGFLLIVVTNQPDVARGTLDQHDARAINEHVKNALALDDVYACYHDNADGCECRKPKPGMILRAAADHSIALDASFLVGDRYGDIKAGASARVTPILVGSGHDEEPAATPSYHAESLLDAARWIIRSRKEKAVD